MRHRSFVLLLRPKALLFCAITFLLPASLIAGSVTLFDRTFVRETGQPRVETFDFAAPAGSYQLEIETRNAASAIITINGATVFAPNDFNNNVTRLTRTVRLQARNRASVELRGQPGATLRFFITAEDAVPPTITATVTPPPNAAGWHRGDVRVTFVCADAFGIASCPEPMVVTTEGARQIVTQQATDRAGNVATTSVTLNIDRTPPTIAPSTMPPANDNGWHRADATVTFACADALSGIASCAPPSTVTTEGSAQSVQGQATDIAGNTATATATVSLDKTAPRITASLSAPANAAGWHNAPVTVTFTCADETGSGVEQCAAPVTVNGDGAAQLVTGSVQDRAGNTASASATVSLDTQAPTVRTVVTPPAVDGWHAGDVTVSFECDDAGSGVIECPASRVLTAEGAAQAVTATITDRAGNTTEASTTVNIDRSAPTIQAVVTPAANAEGWHRAPLTVSFVCSDALSGIATCPAPVTVDQQGAERAITATVRDRAGNAATASATVNLDLTPPTIRAIPSASVANGSVTVRFECEDAESGIAECPQPIVLAAEGADQVASGEARDRAGNTARATVSVTIDLSKPTIIATLSPASQNGWNNTPVVVSFTCADTGSGVASCPEPITVSQEGAAQTVAGTVRDAAGNEASVSVSVNIDSTPPVIRAVPSTADWTRDAANVRFECEDALSGVTDCPSPQTVDEEGERNVSGTVSDRAGNTASASAVVRIDRTAPVVTATLDREPNAAGWHNQPVVVTFTCNDAGAGVAECPAPVTVSSEGAAQVLARTVIDRAGNSATFELSLSVDLTPPTVEATGTSGWSNTDAAITFVCADALSGIAACPPQQTVSADGVTTIEGIARDKAGNTATTTVTVNIDRTPPTIAANLSQPANAAGWHRGPVTVTFTCSDTGSSVVSCPEPITIDRDGAAQSVSGTAVDAAGNRATAAVTLNIDTTPPAISPVLNPPAEWSNTDVQVSFTCSDATSGVASCATPSTVGSEGANQRVEGRAVDQAGNEAVATATVNIDRTAPVITATAAPAANAQGWHRADATVSFECSDAASGVDSCTPSQVVSEEGRNRVVTGTVRDRAGNIATTSLTLNLDKTAPTVAVTSPDAGTLQKSSPLALSGTFADALSGALAVTCNGQTAGLTGGRFSCETALVRGAQQITVAAVDAAGNTGTALLAVNFDPNTTPIAVPGGPYTGEANAALSFNGAASSDPDGQAITYSWDFGDGATATTANPSHAYANAGTYVVRLTVRDPDGATNTATTSAVIAVANRMPVASAGGPYTSDVGEPVSFDASASTDPDSDTLSYSWTFGDGGTGTGQRPRRTYLTAGTFTATVTVTDGRGGKHSSQAQVTIRTANQNPIAHVGGPYSGGATQAINFSGAASRDPDNDPLTFTWAFGDGATATGADVTHAYAAAGNYNVSLTVTDNRGGSHSAGTTVAVAAANSAPTARAGGPYSALVGRALVFDGSQSIDPDNDALTYSWSFGDGRSRTGATPEHTYTAAGTYTATLTVDDGHGGVNQSTAAVTVTEPTAEDNRAPIANAAGPYSGEAGIAVRFDGAASVDADGDALQYSWAFSDGTTASGSAPVHVFATANTYTATLTVTDGRGGTHSATASVMIAPPQDRAPPAVRLSGPAQVLPGTTAVVTATAEDNIGVVSVTFDVPNAEGSIVNAPPYQHTVSVPAVASPGDSILVKATAIDAAGNSNVATFALTITASPDTIPPTVSVAAPSTSAAGATLRIGATATDASGIASLLFRINGQVISGGSAPYFANYQIPADIAAGSTVTVIAEALDFAGNRGTAQAQVTVAASGDVTPPAITVVAPPTSRAGAEISLVAQAADEGGLAGVMIVVDGVTLATFAAPPYQVAFRVPDSAIDGLELKVEARAVDFAGHEARANAITRVVGAGVAGGLITGEIYDDTTGLPIAGAVATIDGTGASGVTATSDARGRFVLRGDPGDAIVRITKAGYTTVDRTASLESGQAVELFDARLTPAGGAAVSIAPVLGGSLESSGVTIAVPAGAVAAPTSLILTRVGGQGLRGLLPAGWSPVASFDLAPGGVTFATAATARASRNAVPDGTALVFATWDTQRGGWRAVATTVAGPGGEPLEAAIDGSGQYAWLRADAAPAVPPAAVIGELLGGVPVPTVADAVVATVNPQPKVIFYKAGVRSDVVGTLTLPTAMSSGTRMWSRLTESYSFFSKAQVHPEPWVQDLVFYQKPDDDQSLMAAYPVTPSMTFEELTLDRGIISAELIAPPEGAADVRYIDATGGQVTLATGERLDVAAGVAVAPLAARLTPLAATEIGVPIPAGVDLVGAVLVSLSGATLGESAVLSIARPAGLADGAQVLLTRAETVQGTTKLVLVGLGKIEGDRVVSVAQLPKNQIPFEGVRTGGRYVFVRPAVPVGFAAGQVIGPQGGLFAGAQISTDALPIVSLSRSPGGYVAAAKVGAVKLTALDLQKADTGFAQANLGAAGDELAIDLRLIAQPPRVVSVSPANGTRNVAPSDPIVVVFSEPVDPGSISGNVRLTTGGVLADVTSGLTANNTTLTLRPAQPLAADATYTLTVEKVKDDSGYQLAAAVVTEFFTIDTSAPLPPAAGTISAEIPQDGTTTVRGTQGTADPRDTVSVENITRGTSTPVLLNPNGGFLVLVQASVGDVLKIKMVDAAGNETVVDVPRFTRSNADGSVTASVGADGGRVEGPGGVAVDIDAGTFPAGTLVTIKPVVEAEMPVQLTAEQKTLFGFGGGVKLDFGGAEPQKYVDVSIPAKPEDTEKDQWVVAEVVTVNGVETFNMADMASLENGRITTASPPCPGVTGSGVYGIYKSKRDVGLNYGEIYHNDVNGGLRLDVEPMIVGIGAFAMPFPVIVMKQRQPVCMPVLTGNVSISENQLDLTIDPAQVTPVDRSIVVVNNSVNPAARYSFPRNILEYAFRVQGREDDPIDVIVEKTDGSRVTLTSQEVASIRKDAGASTVTIRLNMDKLKVTPKKFIIANKSSNPPVETVFEQTVSPITLSVAGAPGNTLAVSAIEADGSERPIQFTVTGSTYPSGNLALRAVSGTIDPTPEQIVEYNAWPVCGPNTPYPCRGDLLNPDRGVTKVMLGDENSAPSPGPGGTLCGYAVCLEIPLTSIERGAVVFPFTGDRSHRYRLHVFYKDTTRDALPIAGYRLVLTSVQTGRVIQRITAQAPPRSAPVNLGLITDDHVRPVLTDGPPRFDAFDPSQPLKFTFSEAIDEQSAKRLMLRDANNQQIPIANVIVSPDGKTVTFVPKSSLKLGETYTLDFSDVTDIARNKVLGLPITLKSFAPKRLCMNDGGCQATDTGAAEFTMVKGADIRVGATGAYSLALEPIADLDFLRQRDSQGRLRTNLFLTLGGYGQLDYRVSAIDVTDPRQPFEMGRDFGGRGKRRMTLLAGLQNFRVAPQYTPGMANSPYIFAADPANEPCPVPNLKFTGDIAVTSSFTPEMSGLTFYNVTDPWKPCVLGDKLITASPFALNDFTRNQTIHASGFARGVATIKHDAGISVYTAVGEVGVTATDLAENIPSRYPATRIRDAYYSGDVIDLKAFRDRLVIARRDGPLFEVLDANLTPIASIPLPQRPVHLVTTEAFQFDANQDGQITQDEVKDLALVATDTCSYNSGNGTPCAAQLQVIDITTLAAPSIIGTYMLPGAVFSLDLDAARQRLVVGGARWDHLGGGNTVYMIDLAKPDEAARDANGDGWDDRIVWRHDYDNVRPGAVKIDKDRGLAYVGLTYASVTRLERGAIDIWALFDDCCDLGVDFTAEPEQHPTGEDVLDREVRALRAGIKSGLDAAASCQISTTGLAMLEQGSGACIWRGDCDGTYQPGVSDHDYEVFFPQAGPDMSSMPAPVRCVIDKLNEVFKDQKPVKFTNRVGREDEMSFDDVTFYPVSMDELTRGRLGIHPPTAAGGSDPGGDLGMGRQQLLLKWLLEGEYVHGVPGYNLKGQNLDWVLQLLRTSAAGDSPTGVPLLEGYEWARLMEFNLAKAKTYIRIKGASDTTSSFHGLYVKQLHDAGKFGLRAALARLVASKAENERAIGAISRSTYHSSAGCLEMVANAPSTTWRGKSCGSFEEYVASAAARSPLYTETERQLVARFYRVKSDKEMPANEAAADAFITATSQFVEQVKRETYPVYAQTIQQDPLITTRLANMSALVGGVIEPAGIGGKLAKALKESSLKLAPRFFNQGFRNADEVLAVMYRDVVGASGATEVKTLRVSLAGGESRFIKGAANAGVPLLPVTEVDRNLNDISDIDVDSRAYQFALGAGTGNNPYIDQTTDINQLKNVVFTIDLPSRSGESGHKVNEAERKNNYGGFQYYILDRQTAANAPAASAIPLPLAPFVLDSDPSCFAEPQIRVMSQSISFADNKLKLNLWNTSTETLFNVQVCSDLAAKCQVVGTLQAQQVLDVPISFNPPSQAGSYGSNVTIYAKTITGQNVALRWNNTVTSAGAPFVVRAYDNTPLNAIDHPLSRYTLQHDTMGNDLPLSGALTDGTDRAVRIRIEKLRPGVAAVIRLLDSATRKVEDGTGNLELGGVKGSELTATPDLSGVVELYYTPPAVFVRPGMAHQNDDFKAVERGVRISVVQDQVGVSNADLTLRRPPVFLAHGLFGDINVWKDFSPLVPELPAQYYAPRDGYDGRFDLFVVGAKHFSDRFKDGAMRVKGDIAFSLDQYLPGYAIGKVDIIGHSMGGVLARKLTNDDPQIRDAVRKLILINSPQGGSPVADRMVEARDKLPLKVEGLPSNEPPDPNADKKAAIDLLDLDPDKISSVSPVKLKVEWCSAVLNSLGRTVYLNVHKGGVDDLQTALISTNGAQTAMTEIGRIVFGEWEVPTHHVVTTTTQNDLGFSTEVTAMWSALGLMCNMTPDATTLEKTKLLQISAEAVKTLAPLFKGANATRTMHKRPFGSLESKKILVDTLKGTMKKGLEELFIGEDPTIVFTTSNDRVVPVWSQLGDGVDDSLPPGPLGLGHPAVTEVFGPADHQSAKITPGINPLMCTVFEPGTGLISFDKRITDLNGDTKPDPTCQIMNLLEADPNSSTFIKTGGQ